MSVAVGHAALVGRHVERLTQLVDPMLRAGWRLEILTPDTLGAAIEDNASALCLVLLDRVDDTLARAAAEWERWVPTFNGSLFVMHDRRPARPTVPDAAWIQARVDPSGLLREPIGVTELLEKRWRARRPMEGPRGLLLDCETNRAIVDGVPMPLSALETRLLAALLNAPVEGYSLRELRSAAGLPPARRSPRPGDSVRRSVRRLQSLLRRGGLGIVPERDVFYRLVEISEADVTSRDEVAAR